MKFTIEHARRVAAELYGDPFARCSLECEACNAMAEDWERQVSQVLAALKVLEGDK